MKALPAEQSILIVPDSWAPSLPEQPTMKEIEHLPFIMLGAMENYSFHTNLLEAFKSIISSRILSSNVKIFHPRCPRQPRTRHFYYSKNELQIIICGAFKNL